MSYDIEVLSEVYLTLKQYIPSKDRQEAADTLVGILADYMSDEDFRSFCQNDKYTKAAAESYDINLDEDDDREDY